MNQKKTILLVDDDESFRELIIQGLQSKGYKVLEAGSGNEALQLLEVHTPDLLVVDGFLPDTDGEEWIAERRAEGINTPIVFVSGYWHEPSAYSRLTDELGVDFILHKPVMPLSFTEQVSSLLSRDEANLTRSENSNTLETALTALRVKYLQMLPQKTKELANVFEKAKSDPENQKALLAVRSCAHKLRGTAGSYGFLKYSECVGTIEDTIIKLLNVQNRPTPADWSLLEQSIREAESLANGLDENCVD